MPASTASPVTRIGAAEVRVCSRHLATVVTVRGGVTTANLAQVTAQALRYVLPDTAYVLDLSDVKSIVPEASSLLRTIDEACATAGVEWALVTGPATGNLFTAELRDRMLPVVDSVADGLHDFAEAQTTRRTLLLPLLQRSAS